MEGRLIVIDGSDGTGKATQTSLLIERLKKEGKRVSTFDFPQYDRFFGKMVGEYLNNKYGDAVKLDPYLVSMMYAADRWEAKGKILEALNKKETVVLNRYVSSNMAHQGVKFKDGKERKKYLAWLEELEFSIYGVPKPDKVVILAIPVDVSQQLVDKKGQRLYTDKRDAHESDSSYLKDVAEMYRILAKEKNWSIIECHKDGKLLSKGEIAELVWKNVKDLI